MQQLRQKQEETNPRAKLQCGADSDAAAASRKLVKKRVKAKQASNDFL